MKPLKVVDVIIQTILIVITLFSIAKEPQRWTTHILILYLFIGPYQVIAHLVSIATMPITPARKLYSICLLIFAFAALFIGFNDAISLLLMVFAGVLGAYYYYLCIIETFGKAKKPN
jgi:hypothetical protein